MRLLSLCGRLSLGVAAVLWTTLATQAAAQAQWKIDSRSSIAWWQVDPHLNHLWATTCPTDPTWRPGEDRTGGWSYDQSLKLPKSGYANVVDTAKMPLFPRVGPAEPICNEAVSGSVTVDDPAHWGGVHGVLFVKGSYLETGNNLRTAYMKRAVLETQRYEKMEFRIDSVTDVQLGDTLRGTFHGMLTLVGTGRPYSGPAKAWYEGDNLRVQARFKIRAADMIDEFGMSKYTLGLGVKTGIWRWIFCGVDVLLTKEGD